MPGCVAVAFAIAAATGAQHSARGGLFLWVDLWWGVEEKNGESLDFFFGPTPFFSFPLSGFLTPTSPLPAGPAACGVGKGRGGGR